MKQALMIMMLFSQSSYVYDFFVSHYPYLDNNMVATITKMTMVICSWVTLSDMDSFMSKFSHLYIYRFIDIDDGWLR